MNTAEMQRQRLRADMASGEVVRWSAMRRDGISRRALVGMVAAGEVERVAHDVYRLSSAPVPRHSGWEGIALKYSAHCVCLLSAARYHNLTTQVPTQTWVALPTGSKPSDPALRCLQWPLLGSDGRAHKAWTLGVEEVAGDNRTYYVTGAARTVVDLYRWRDRLEDGRRIFLESVQEYAQQGRDRAELRRVARAFCAYGPIGEALTAWSEFSNKF